VTLYRTTKLIAPTGGLALDNDDDNDDNDADNTATSAPVITSQT